MAIPMAIPGSLDSSSREVGECCAWVYEFEEQQFRRWLKGDYANRSYRTYGSSDSNVGEGSDLQYDDGTRTDTVQLRNQRKSPLLRLPGELRNTIYGFLDFNGTRTHIVYGSDHIALSQTSRQLRTEVVSYAVNNQSTFYIDYADLGNFCQVFKDMKKNDDSDVIIGVYGTDDWPWYGLCHKRVLMHLQPRRAGGVRYFVMKGIYGMEYVYHDSIHDFLKDILHVGTIKGGVFIEEGAWCYVEIPEGEGYDEDEWDVEVANHWRNLPCRT